MYLFSSCHIILVLTIEIQTFMNEAAGSGKNVHSNRFLVAQAFIEVANCILADSVLIWRVWVVWGRNYWIVAMPISLLVGETITGSLFAYAFHATPTDLNILQGDVLRFAPPAAAFVLCTNVLCTSLIAGRIWYMQRRINAIMVSNHGSANNVYRSAILLVAESGLIYSSSWLVILTMFSSNTNGLFIVFDILSQLSGIIPTMIILLAHLNLIMGSKEHEEYVTTLNNRLPARRQRNNRDQSIGISTVEVTTTDLESFPVPEGTARAGTYELELRSCVKSGNALQGSRETVLMDKIG